MLVLRVLHGARDLESLFSSPAQDLLHQAPSPS